MDKISNVQKIPQERLHTISVYSQNDSALAETSSRTREEIIGGGKNHPFAGEFIRMGPQAKDFS